LRPERTGICLTARVGSLSTDIEYWKRRESTGGPSPTLFAYTLPSAAMGEIAIRCRLTGPNLCFVGGDSDLESEASDLIRRGEADGCVCIACNVVTAEAAELVGTAPTVCVCAFLLTRTPQALPTAGAMPQNCRVTPLESLQPDPSKHADLSQ
jgi:3-oxoacyl-(acyl-carrier-protein) synthase